MQPARLLPLTLLWLALAQPSAAGPMLSLTLDDTELLTLAERPRTVAVSEGGVVHASLLAVVPYPATALWPALSGRGAQHDWVPWMRTATVIREASGRTWCEGRTALPWPLKDRAWEIVMIPTVPTEPGGRYEASWTYVQGSGDLRDSTGSWTLQPLDNGRTLVRISAMADLGVPVPGPLLRWIERRGLPQLVDSLVAERSAP